MTENQLKETQYMGKTGIGAKIPLMPILIKYFMISLV
jgi:hypothetical protein